MGGEREEGCILLGDSQGAFTMCWKEPWPKTLQSPKEWDKYKKKDKSCHEFKNRLLLPWLGFVFPFKTTHILKGEGAGEIQPFMLILSGHPEAGPRPLLLSLSRLQPPRAGQGRVGRTAALLVSV